MLLGFLMVLHGTWEGSSKSVHTCKLSANSHRQVSLSYCTLSLTSYITYFLVLFILFFYLKKVLLIFLYK